MGEFPTEGSSFGILTTGDVNSVPDTSTFASTNLSGGNVRGNTDFDVTVLKVDLAAQPGANCLTFDYKFLSEEYPGFVNTSFNDAFIAELDTSTWTTSGSTITAPNDFVVDSSQHVISINSSGLGGMSAGNGAGTAFNGTQSYNDNFYLPPGNAGGATGLLHAATQVAPGPHSVYFSIFDQGDHRLDSATFLDNLTDLELAKNRMSFEGAQALAEASRLPKLAYLGLNPSEHSSGGGLAPTSKRSKSPVWPHRPKRKRLTA